MSDIAFNIADTNKENKGIKKIINNTLKDFDILEALLDDKHNLYEVKIKNDEYFYSILKLFYCLYILEKLYSQKYSISTDEIDNAVKEEFKRHLLSAIPKDKQAYLLNVGNSVVLVTYFGCHDKHINLFSKSNILVGDFKKAIFKNVARTKYTDSTENCPIILAFKYHLSEASHIINNKLNCNPSIELNEFECTKSKSTCNCLEKIETILLKDSENRDCNLRIFGGSQIFFNIDYEIISRLISLESPGETLRKRGYESIFNFLLGCYLSDRLGAKFNSNVLLKFDGMEKEVDILLFLKKGIAVIETTREHSVCSKDDYFEKLEKSILKCIPVHISTTDHGYKLKYVLVTLTPESKFTKCIYYVTFARSLFNFEHIGIPDEEEVTKFIEGAKYFSPKNTQKILDYQLNRLVDSLSKKLAKSSPNF